MYLCGIADQDSYDSAIEFWEKAYGLQFRCLKQHNLRYPAVEVVRAGSVVTNRAVLRNFDLMTCSAADTEFEVDFELVATNTCSITALVGFFDVSCCDAKGKQKVRKCKVD